MANKFSLTFDVNANVAPFKAAIESMSQSFTKLKLPDNIGGKFGGELSSLTGKLEKFSDLASKPFHNLGEIERATKLFEDIELHYKKLSEEATRLKGIDPEKLIPAEVNQKLKQFERSWNKIESAVAKKSKDSGLVDLKKDLQAAQDAANKTQETLNKLNTNKASKNNQITMLTNQLAEARQRASDITDVIKKLETEKRGTSIGGLTLGSYRDQLEATNNSITKYTEALAQAKTEVDNFDNQITLNSDKLINLKTTINDLTDKIDKTQTIVKGFEAGKVDEVRRQVAELTGLPLDQVATNFEGIKTQLNQFKTDLIAQGAQRINDLTKATELLKPQVESAKIQLQGFNREAFKLSQSAQDFDHLTSRLTMFFGAANGFILMRRAIQKTVTTIKDLDAAMTEMAVVTKLDVSDYWDQLPQYADRANKLGVAIKDVYEASTLFYQQGLKTNEVVELSNETLEMARIAGLEAAEATDRMTNALRGFNMELNETSAQRVADVYSQLAAMSASNVNEISTAMTKVASLASNAGMEFETTAAFLSQIIETTRESAETAGTALKTVIARFQEMKKDPSEVGEVEGEIVDVNKIEGALRSVGVALRDSAGQFRDLDDVFLELASKWNTLDTNTQRYVATMAAGSRQQSRFIAMMSDYARTQELVTAANTSVGASSAQYAKTLDSMQSKLAQLKNAWDTFSLDILNSNALKAAVDALRGILNSLNKITDILPGFTSSVAKAMIAFGSFKIGKSLITLLIEDLKMMQEASKTAAATAGAQSGAAYATAFSAAARRQKFGFEIKSQASVKALSDMKTALNETAVASRKVTSAKGVLTKATKKANAASEEYKKVQTASNRVLNNARNGEEAKRKATEKLTAAQKNLDAATEKQTAAQVKLGAATEASALADQNYKSAKEAVAAATGLEIRDELVLANGLTLKNAVQKGNITTEEAALLSSKLLTDEERKQYAARLMNTEGISDEERAQIIKEITDKLEIRNIKEKITNKMREHAARMLTVGALILEAFGISGNILLKKAEEAANWSLLKSIGAVVLGYLAIAAVIIAVILVIKGIIAVVKAVAKAIKALTPEGQLEAAKEATERAAEAAKRCNEEYTTLVDTLSNIDEKRAAIGDLTEGTLEWRKAVAELNNEVIDLIDKYPELGEFVTHEGNLLVIDYETVINGKTANDVINDYANRANNAKNSEITAKRDELVRQENVDREDAQKKAGLRTINNQLFDELAVDIFDKTGTELEDAIQHWEEANGKSINLTEEQLKAVQDWGRQLQTNDFQDEAFAAAQATNAMANVDYGNRNGKSLDTSKGIVETFGTADMFNDIFEKEKQAALERYDSAKEDMLTEYAKSLGIDPIRINEAQGKIIYEDGQGEEVEIQPSKEEVASRLASDKATNTMTETLEKMPVAIEKAQKELGYDKKTSTVVNKALTNDENSLTNKDLEIINTENAEQYANEILEQLPDEVKDSFGVDEEGNNNFIKVFTENVEAASNAYANVKDVLGRFGIDGNFAPTITAGAATAISDEIIDIVTASGTEAGNTIMGLINDIDFESEDDAIQFGEVLASIDWSSVESIESLSDELLNLGISVPADEIDKLEAQMIQLGNATTSLDVEKVNEYVRSLSKIQLEIQGTTTKSFSDEQYKTLTESGAIEATEFVYNIETDTWDYLGESTNEIVAAIQQQTNDLLGRNLESDITTGEAAQAVANGEIVYDLNQATSEEGNGALDYIKKVQEEAFKLAYNEEIKRLEDQGITGKVADYLATNAASDAKNAVTPLNGQQLASMTDEQIIKLASEIQQKWFNLQENKNLYENQQYQSKVSQTQLNGAEYNANALTTAINKDDADSIKIYTTALELQARAAGISEQAISEFKTEVSKGTKEERAATAAAFANTIAHKKQVAAYAKDIKAIQDLKDEYKNMQTAGDKANIVQKMINNMGLDVKVDESNFEAFYNALDAISEGSAAAYKDLLDLCTQDWSLDVTLDADNSTLISNVDASKTDVNKLLELLAQLGAVEVTYVEGESQAHYWTQREDGSLVELTKTNTADWPVISIKQPDITTAHKPLNNGGGGGSQVSYYEPDYDKYYNKERQLESMQRKRELNETKLEILKTTGKATAQAIADYAATEITNLLNQNTMAKGLLANRQQEMSDYLKANSGLNQYANYDKANNIIQINWDLIESQRGTMTEEEGQKIDDYIAELERIHDDMLSAEDTMVDTEKEVATIRKQQKDEAQTVIERVRDAIYDTRQEEIDKLEDISNSIADAQSAVIDSIEEEINAQRQERNNQEKIEDIDKKRQRLSYLKMDTSGANSLEIYQLEEEIKNLEEDYTDTLIDQAIQDMRDANEEAKEQREEQLEIMQAQLDWDLETGSIAAEAIQMLKESATEGTADLAKLLEKAEGWTEGGEYNVHSKITELPEEVGTFMAGMDAYFAEGYIGEGNPDKYAKDTNIGGGGKLSTSGTSDGSGSSHPNAMVSNVKAVLTRGSKGEDVKILQRALTGLGYSVGTAGIDGLFGPDTDKAVRAFQSAEGLAVDGSVGPKTKEKFKLKGYSTGGLADFTGPAWLDGTKQHPELILNAQDTANFIQLKNVLSEWMASNGLSTTSQNNGDTYFDIDINVEEIGDDYSVDQLKEKIQSEILTDAMYRNVNAISLSR